MTVTRTGNSRLGNGRGREETQSGHERAWEGPCDRKSWTMNKNGTEGLGNTPRG